MPAPLSGIDHVIVAVRDLERARLAWERLGFTLTPRGRHLQQGTGNYCIMFAQDYIELLGVVDPAQSLGNLEAMLLKGEGLGGLAFATRSGDETAAELARLGLHPTAPRDLSRQLELPEGTVLPRFKLVSLPPEETPALACFICQHLTPELVRRRDWLAHANGIIGIAGLTVMVEATEPLRAAYDRLFSGRVNTTDDVLTVHAGAHRVVFATPDDVAALYPEAEIDLDRALPSLAALTLRSSDLDRTADHLTQWQVQHEELADGTLILPPREATGAVLVVRR
jgi:catechol 2,3-dioxygenase-like lactoylglutathione lyase family enzyme